MQIDLVMPFPPTVNHYWVHTRQGIFLSREAKQYRTDVTHAVMRQIKPPWPRMAGRLTVEVEVSPPDKRRRDLDNLHKGLLDSLVHAALFLDDEQIDRLVIERAPPSTTGFAKVRIIEHD